MSSARSDACRHSGRNEANPERAPPTFTFDRTQRRRDRVEQLSAKVVSALGAVDPAGGVGAEKSAVALARHNARL